MCDSCVRAITVSSAIGLPPTLGRLCTVRRVPRRRADTLLAERGLAPSRTAAAASVRAGRGRLAKDGSTLEKPRELLPESAGLLGEGGRQFVSPRRTKVDKSRRG